MLLHTEYSLLSMLKNENGVIGLHGMFSVRIYKNLRDSVFIHFINIIKYCI